MTLAYQIAPAGSAMKKAAIKKAAIRRAVKRAVLKKAVKRALLKRAVKKRAVKRAVAKRAVKKRAVKRAVAKRAVRKRVVKKAVRRRVAGKAVRKRAVKRAVRRRSSGRRSGRGSRARRQPGWRERSCVRPAERPREHVFPLRDLVRSHEAGLAFAGAPGPAGAPSRPVVINRSPPLARIVKWAALLAAATELAGDIGDINGLFAKVTERTSSTHPALRKGLGGEFCRLSRGQ